METYLKAVNCKSKYQFFAGLTAGLLIFTFCFLNAGQAEESQSKLRHGLANRYKGDKGIEKDPDVIFAENFEADSLEIGRASCRERV